MPRAEAWGRQWDGAPEQVVHPSKREAESRQGQSALAEQQLGLVGHLPPARNQRPRGSPASCRQ